MSKIISKKILINLFIIFTAILILASPQKVLGDVALQCGNGYQFLKMPSPTCENKDSFCSQACNPSNYPLGGYSTECRERQVPFGALKSCAWNTAYQTAFVIDPGGTSAFTTCSCRTTPPALPYQINIGIYNKYSIKGNIFLDSSPENKIKDTGESYYGGAGVTVAVSPTAGAIVTQPDGAGAYKITGLTGGTTYTVTFSLPSGSDYKITYPLALPGYSLPVIVGPVIAGIGCDTKGATGASCDAGNNIVNLNAGVNSARDPWFQSVGADMRWDQQGSFQSNGKPLSLPSGKYASVPPPAGGMPGIIFSGATTFTQPASEIKNGQFNWRVGTPAHSDFFTTSHNAIPSSYNFLRETALGSDVKIKTGYPINESLAHDIYEVTGPLTIGSKITFSKVCGGLPSCNYIILINGDLNIDSDIIVPSGSTAIFSASGNINVGTSVKRIEGLYSADNSFIVTENSSCVGISTLNVAGTVVANAARRGGSFSNERTLCTNNATTPSIIFTERPDFILNYPSMVKQTTRIWQDVAP